MSQNVTDLSVQQNQAIDLLISGKTIGDTAQALGIHRRTLWRWRQLPAFQEVLNEIQNQQREQMREQVSEIMHLCLVSLARELRNAEKPQFRNPLETTLAVLKLIRPDALFQPTEE